MNFHTPAIIAALGEVYKVNAQLREVIREEQLKCTHPVLLEAPYESDRWGPGVARPPLRMCCSCGMSEDGWTFKVLNGPHYHSDRTTIYQKRLGLHIDEEKQTRLLRKQTTVEELIRSNV